MKTKVFTFFWIIIVLIGSCSERKETILRMPIGSMPQDYSISVSTNSYVMLIFRNIHDVLIEYENGSYINRLAESWNTPTSTQLTVKIRDNAYFSDGSPVTANDVKESYLWMMNNPRSPFYDTIPIDSMVARDNFIDIYCSRDISLQGGFISLTGIMKANDLKKGEEYLNNHITTAGVYYVYFKNNERIILKKNKYHRDFLKNKKAPDTIELILEPSRSNQYEMLINDEVDFIEFVDTEKYDEILASKKYQILEKDSNLIVYMMLNSSNHAISNINFNPLENYLAQNNTIKNPLHNKKVRQAMAHAIDTQSYIDNYMAAKAYPIILPALRNSFGFPTDKPCYEFDLKLAKKLMKEAGYQNGFEINIHTANLRYNRPFADFIKECLEKINITTNVIVLSSEEMRERDTNRAATINAINIRSNFTLANTLSPRYIYLPNTPSGDNLFGNYNPKINELLYKITALTPPDPDLIGLYKELTDVIIDETFIIPFLNPFSIYAINKKFSYNHTPDLKFTDFYTN